MDCALTEHRGDYWKKDLEFHLVTLLVQPLKLRENVWTGLG